MDQFLPRTNVQNKLRVGTNDPDDDSYLHVGGNAVVDGTHKINTIPALADPATVFHTNDDGVVNTRTAAEVLSDIDAASSEHEHNADEIIIPDGIGTPSYDDMQDFLNNTRSAGRITGGVIIPNAAVNGKIDVSELEGMIFTADSLGSPLVYFKKTAVTDVVVTDDLAVSYVYYDHTTDSYLTTTDRTAIHAYDQFVIARVWRSGNSVEVQSTGFNIYNYDRLAHDRLLYKYGNMDRVSGAVVSAHATALRLTCTAGAWYSTTSPFTTLLADTFYVWYKTGGGAWTESAELTLFSAVFDGGTSTVYETYQNGTSLAALGVAKYGVYWIFICPEGGLYVVLGTASYNTIGTAQASKVPSSLPPYLVNWGRLIGRVICQNSGAAFYSVESVFETSFAISAAVDHTSLSNLNTTLYTHLTAANHTDLTDGGATVLHHHGAGTTNYLTKYTDGATGVIGNSVLSEVTGNIINGTGYFDSKNFYYIDGVKIVSNAGSQNIMVGALTGNGGVSTNGVHIGYGAGQNTTAAGSNAFNLGAFAGNRQTTAVGCVNIGPSAGFSNVVGNSIVNIGYRAGYNNIASYSVYIGTQAGELANNAAATHNTCVGFFAGNANLAGIRNCAFGAAALQNNLGGYNCAFGPDAAKGNTTGQLNIAMGYRALYTHTTGDANVALGDRAFYTLGATTAPGVAIGPYAGYYETESSKLFIDNAFRAGEADGRVKALVYGVFAAVATNQLFRVNGHFELRDNLKIKLGTSADFETYRDSVTSNWIFNSRVVGTGNYVFSGGNVGISKTPELWDSSYVGVNVGYNAALMAHRTSGTEAYFLSNIYYDGAWKNRTNAGIGMYSISGGVHSWYTNAAQAAGDFAPNEKMRLDNKGVVGVGVTPQAWHATTYNTIQLGAYGSISSTKTTSAGGTLLIGHNYFYDGAEKTFNAIGDDEASYFSMQNGAFFWASAAAQAAGAVTMVTKMSLSQVGVLSLYRPGVSWSDNQKTAFGCTNYECSNYAVYSATNGGLWLSSFTKGGASDVGSWFTNYSESDLTTYGSFLFHAYKHNGSGALTAHGGTAKILGVRNNVSELFTILGTGQVDIKYGGTCLNIGADSGASTRTNATNKYGYASGVHYTNAYNPVFLIGYSSTSPSSTVYIGGGVSGYNAATNIFIKAAATTNAGVGISVIDISAAAVNVNVSANNIDFNWYSANGSAGLKCDASARSNLGAVGICMAPKLTGGLQGDSLLSINTPTQAVHLVDITNRAVTTPETSAKTALLDIGGAYYEVLIYASNVTYSA